MFAAFANNASLAVNDASAPTAKDDFVNDPEKLCTEIVVRDQQNQVAFHYRVQDSPGEHSMAAAVASHCTVPTGAHRKLVERSNQVSKWAQQAGERASMAVCLCATARNCRHPRFAHSVLRVKTCHRRSVLDWTRLGKGYDSLKVNMEPVLDDVVAANQSCLKQEQCECCARAAEAASWLQDMTTWR